MMTDTRANIRLAQLHLYVDIHLHDRYLAPPLTLVVAALLTNWVPVAWAAAWAGAELLIIANYPRLPRLQAQQGHAARRAALGPTYRHRPRRPHTGLVVAGFLGLATS